MLFMIFVIIAIWMVPPGTIPLWLQICLTIFGALHALFHLVEIGSDD